MNRRIYAQWISFFSRWLAAVCRKLADDTGRVILPAAYRIPGNRFRARAILDRVTFPVLAVALLSAL
jgi:hypothetical protein